VLVPGVLDGAVRVRGGGMTPRFTLLAHVTALARDHLFATTPLALTAATGLSPARVKAALHDLTSGGFIVRLHRGNSGANPSRYRIVDPAPVKVAAPVATARVNRSVVLAHLLRVAVDGGFSATTAQIAAAVGIGGPRVKRALYALIAAGAIRSLGYDGRTHTTHYRISGSPAPIVIPKPPARVKAARRITFGLAPTPQPDPVRLVAPGSFPVRGFSMLGGRVR